jgi:glycosyltransferase involved in cell wall biosynthesis
MKILQLPAYFLPHKGGMEYHIYNLCKQFVKADHEVVVLTSNIGAKRDEEVLDGIVIKRVPAFSFMQCPISFNLPFMLLKLIHKEKPDVLHIRYPHPYFLEVGVLAGILKKIPIVLNCHGKEMQFNSSKNLLMKPYNKIFFNLALSKASQIITNTKGAVITSSYLSKYEHKIKAIHPGVDTQRFNPHLNTNLKERMGLENNKILLYVGALREYKGLTYLIHAMPIIIDNIPNVKLIVVGKGEEEEKLKNMVKKLNLTKYVMFTGFVFDEDLIEYYSICDVFVLPSPTLMESWGNVALEAMAMEKPAIVTVGAGVAEFFKEEKIGVLAKPKDYKDIAKKIIQLLSDEELRREIGVRGRKVILENCNWKKIAQKYLEIYENIKGNIT